MMETGAGIRGRSAMLSSGKVVYPLDEVSLREDVEVRRRAKGQ
jgi:hypothetical protein